MKQEIAFAGPQYKFDNPAISDQETINYYVEVGGENTRSPLVLRGFPGHGSSASLTKSGATQALEALDYDNTGTLSLMACINGEFGVVSSATTAVFTKLGDVNAATTRYHFADMRSYIIIADRPIDVINGFAIFPSDVSECYVYNKTSTAFADIQGTVPAFGGHNDDTFFISALDDPQTYDPLDFSSVNTRYNRIVACVASLNRLVIFGTVQIDFYYFSGDSFPFEKQQGATIELGCDKPHTITNIDGVIYFLATNNIVYRIAGFEAQPIGSEAINDQINKYTTFTTAQSWTFNWKGHIFYALYLAGSGNDDRTYLFDTTVPIQFAWSRRKSAGVNKWEGFLGTNAYGLVYVGHETANIYSLDNTEADFTEAAGAIEATRTMRYISASQMPFKIPVVEVVCKQDSGYGGGEGVNLSFSKDGGESFSSERERVFESTKHRLIWRDNGKVEGAISFKLRTVANRNRDILSFTAKILLEGNR